MRKHLIVLFAVVACSLAAYAETYAEFDARVEKELAAKDPSAVVLWKQANAARDAQHFEQAAALYGQVFAKVPSFDHALRRQAGAEDNLGLRDVALTHARMALSMQRSPENLGAVASVLASKNATPGELQEAKSLANEAAQLEPDDVYAQTAMARVAMASNDLDLLRGPVRELERLAPKDPNTHFLRSMILLSDGEYDDATVALDRARELGLPAQQYSEMREFIETSKPFYVRWWKPVAIAFAAWFGGFALMLLAGAVLSRIALRAAADTTNLSSAVRRIYRIVLGVSCAFYYASIPLVIVSVLALTGGLIYACFALGHVPIKLVVILVVVAGVSVWSMLKSIFIRRKDEDPGLRLDLSEEPKLRQLLDGVAARIGTRPVDNVYLTPSTDIAVMERRSKERCLILGVAVLDGLQVRPFKAILGHEYGHFSNRDTAGGSFALSVRQSLLATAIGLAQGGVATWYNPAWWFVNGFHRLFLRISEGASRLQEVLADRWAVAVYGAHAFEAGLRHVVERGVRFDAHAGVTLKEVVDGKLPLTNLYTYQPAAQPKDVTTAVEEALNRKSSAYDSHPAPLERFALVHALPQPAFRSEPDDDAPAWSLFHDPEKLQHAMTAQVRDNVRANYGVEIAV